MPLTRQLMLLVSFLFLLIFAGNFAIGVNRTRDYVQVASKVHAQDTATSLGLSLSPHLANPRDPILETMIKAIFDMGYYTEITLSDMDGNTLVRLDDGRGFEQVPQWFVKLLPMRPATAVSEISSGWNSAGSVSVTINPGYAYLELYEQLRGAWYYSLGAFALSLLPLFLVLHFTLQPLKVIDRQARRIAGGSFSRITDLPWTLEVRNLAVSMNVLCDTLEGVITGLNRQLETLGQRILRDEVTGLQRKISFEEALDTQLQTAGGGYLCSLRIEDFAERARDQGDAATDEFLKRFADVLTQCATAHDPAATAYRFYGSEFALLMPGLLSAAVEPFAQYLRQRLTWLGEQCHKPDIVHIGIAACHPEGTGAGLLAAANAAREQAGLIGVSSYFICRDAHSGKTAHEWRDIVVEVLATGRFRVAYVGQVEDLRTGAILMEEAVTQALDQAGETLAVGLFVSMAEKFQRIAELDTAVTRRVVARLQQEPLRHAIAINLSLATLRNTDFRSLLGTILRGNPTLAQRLVFSVTAYSAAKDLTLFRDFTDFAHGLGARILLKRYDTQFMSIDTIKSLKPDYIRLGRDLTCGISSQSGKRLWVEAMKQVADILQIAIIAEEVQHASDLAAVRGLGLAGASR